MRTSTMGVIILISITALAAWLLYSLQQPSSAGRTYVLQGQDPNKVSLSTVCSGMLYKCASAPNPCPEETNQIPCSWRIGPTIGMPPTRKSGCFKTCFQNGNAALVECR